MAEIILSNQLSTLGVSLHTRILEDLVKQVEDAIADGRIRSEGEMCSIYDFYSEVMKVPNGRQSWKTFTSNDDGLSVQIWTLRKLKGERSRETPVTNLAGLIYIAYVGSGKFSHNLRASSAALLSSHRAKDLEVTVEEARSDHQRFPLSIDELQRTTNIVNKSQMKRAIERDLIEDRDYRVIGGKIFLTVDMYNILCMSFRSLAGTDVSRLPEIIRVETQEYFRYQSKRRKNTVLAKRDRTAPGQMSLFE